jgi:Tfp pilus assembly protein PilX
MRHHNTFPSKIARRTSRQQQRGVALITTLLLLLLLTAISLTMVLSVSSDMLINGYYRDYRGSFYASDAGVNVARQAMINGILAAAPVGAFPVGAAPIPIGTDVAVQNNVLAAYAAPTVINSPGSWPESFQIVNTAKNPTSLASPAIGGCTPVWTGSATVNGAPISCTNLPGAADVNTTVTGFKYVYNYSISAVGASQGSEVSTVGDSGTLTFFGSITKGGKVQTSFAAWGMFIDQYALCGGGDLVPGTITGPVFTNGAWNFGSSGKYIFTDPVGSANSQAGFDNGGCKAVAGASGNGIAPTFQNGFNLGQPTVPLPQNDFNQKEAVIDGKGNSGSPTTNAQLNAALRDVKGTSYPAGGAASGVYLPYTIDAKTGAKTYNGGGIYVEGNASVTLSVPDPKSNTTAQIYTIVQNGVTTTVTIDDVAGTTSISSGGVTTTMNGVPAQVDPNTGAVTRDATMLYVDGNITSLSGPATSNAPGGLQNDTALTITANGSVTVTGDVKYVTEPVTTAQNQIANTPADTLIPGNDHGQVLGIFTATGNVNLDNQQASGNLEIDASIATISNGGSGGITNTGAGINTLNIIGGRIQNTIQNIGASTRNVFFDRRFTQGGFSPPWFPSTTVTQGGADIASFAAPTVTHTQWLNKTSYQ